MGIQGLRRFIDLNAVAQSLSKPFPVDHVLMDLNCICHSRFGDSPSATVENVKQAISAILELVPPSVSLTIVLDGPASLAKLETQRKRRKDLHFRDNASNSHFNRNQITPGSEFMMFLEHQLIDFCKSYLETYGLAVSFVSGASVMGEGEDKISQILRTQSLKIPIFKRSDRIVVVGNDIDLVLTLVGAIDFFNVFLFAPSTLQLVLISALLYRWCLSGGGVIQTDEQMRRARVDFVFLFNLNGGDCYGGLGDAAAHLWKAYRQHSYDRLQIVSDDLSSVNCEAVALLCGKVEGGRAEDGIELLRCALWATHSCVIGRCTDYAFASSLMGACSQDIVAAARKQSTVHLPTSNAKPLSPLATFVALSPSVDYLPLTIRQYLATSRKVCEKLYGSKTAFSIADISRQIVTSCASSFSEIQSRLCEHGKNVALKGNTSTRLLKRESSRIDGIKIFTSVEPLHQCDLNLGDNPAQKQRIERKDDVLRKPTYSGSISMNMEV